MSLSQRVILPLMAATALALAPLSQAAEAKVLATVNGKNITQQDYDEYVQKNAPGSQQKIDKNRVLNDLISRELIYQDAMKQGLDKDKEVLAKLEAVKHSLILGAALEKAMNNPAISDKELKKLYDERVSEFNVKEYKARHILVKTKDEADKIITELDMGGDFAELAKKKSTGPSGKKGGDLGWFAPQQMVPEFGQAVTKLKKGKYTKTPVKTQFGWHVIKLEDSRSATPPKFDEVKPQLRKVVEQGRANDYLQALKAKADIKVK
jgi:peptidyl-prolyl cis-trans isomerase C